MFVVELKTPVLHRRAKYDENMLGSARKAIPMFLFSWRNEDWPLSIFRKASSACIIFMLQS